MIKRQGCSTWAPKGTYPPGETRGRECPPSSAMVKDCDGCDFQHSVLPTVHEYVNCCPDCGGRWEHGGRCFSCREERQKELGNAGR